MKPRDKLRDLVESIAPASPPCFRDRDTWIEWLVSAAGEQRGKRHPGPLLLRSDPPAFNTRVNFCADCTGNYSILMQHEGLCIPDWLLREESKWLRIAEHATLITTEV